MKPVAITGIGLVTPLAVGTDESWDALLAGDTAVGPITSFDASALRVRLGAELHGFDPTRFMPKRALKLMTRNDQFAVAGAVLAVADSGEDLAALDPQRVALFAGGNKETGHAEHIGDSPLLARGPDGRVDMRELGRLSASQFHPLFYIEGLQAASLFHVSQVLGMMGPNCYFVGTADAGATAIGRACRAVARGEADVAVAGGFDDAVSIWTTSKLDALGVLSDTTDPSGFRPFDRQRSGSLLGEGAAFVVVEDATRAQRRGARVYAEVRGFGRSNDAVGVAIPEPAGRGIGSALSKALDEACTDPAALDYVATHGCATRSGDPTEAAALRDLLGTTGADRGHRLLAGSVKPATGHLVAGAGALNVAVAALAVHRQAVPPTLNLDDIDPSCAHDVIDWVAGEARPARIRTAAALARGLEGQSVALVLTAPRRSES